MYQVIKSKAILDGTGSALIPDGCLLIQNDRIAGVGREEEFTGLDGIVEMVDYTSHYILPGLIDSHNHLSIVPALGDQLGQMALPPGRNILRSMPNIQRSLQSGVTTMRIVGEENFIDVEIKNAIEEALIPGPRLLVSGRGMVASNGHGAALTVSDGEEEIRKHARENFAKGADLIKLFVTGGISSSKTGIDFCSYTGREVRTAVEEAQRYGSYVAAHAHGGAGLDLCIEEGVRTIEHAALINERQLEGVVNKDLWIIGTFSILFHETGIEQTDFSDPVIKEKVLRTREIVSDNFHRVIQSGANLALGTDSMHGLLAYEMECLVRFGATNIQAISAVTKHAAEALRIEDRLGTLEKGKIADFIGLPANPLDDIKNMAQVEFVYKNGKQII
ncbi:metal-dependent hydrolase family protein [Virgibacillus kimchii]